MKICSYFGNLYLDHFKTDLKEIKEHGFNTILFCVTETDMKYSLDNIKEMREYAESQNFSTMAGPWGLAGIFGGEAISTVDYHRDGWVAVETLVGEWIKAVKSIGFTTMFLDEPHLGKDNENLIFLYDLIAKYESSTFDFVVCFADDRFDRLTDNEIRNFPCDGIGVSNYFWHNRWEELFNTSEKRINRLKTLRPHDNLIFVQGFDLPVKHSAIPLYILSQCKEKRVKHIGFWGFRCAEATSTKRAEGYEKLWKLIKV